MSSTFLGLLFSLGTALLVIVGDVALKVAADNPHETPGRLMGAGVALYAVSALFWYHAMRHSALAEAAVAYSMFSLIALCLIGAIGFGEALGLREFAGIGCALMAMGLLSHAA